MATWSGKASAGIGDELAFVSGVGELLLFGTTDGEGVLAVGLIVGEAANGVDEGVGAGAGEDAADGKELGESLGEGVGGIVADGSTGVLAETGT